MHRGAVVHLDRVVDELWEGTGPRNARNAVHVVASRLRAALGDGAVVSEGGGYAVVLPPGALDADRFEEGFRRGRDELARGEPLEAAATLRGALALWRGPALADVRDERFAAPEIARLDDLWLACLAERVDADLACGHHAEVAGELEARVREHPLHERLHGQLMLALYRAGRQADALAAYRSARDALVDGLGIEPSPALRDLEVAILRQDVPSRRSRRPRPACRGARRAPPRDLRLLPARLPRRPARARARDPACDARALPRRRARCLRAPRRHVIELRSDAVARRVRHPGGTRGRRPARAARCDGAGLAQRRAGPGHADALRRQHGRRRRAGAR